MVCKNCGNIILKTDSVCKVCGAVILPESIAKSYETQAKLENTVNSITTEVNKNFYKKRYRSRFALLFLFWIGGFLGLHHAWMGDHEAAIKQLKSVASHFLKCFIAIGIILLMIDVVVYLVDFVAIIFGKYKEDALGNPIVWFKAGKPPLE